MGVSAGGSRHQARPAAGHQAVRQMAFFRGLCPHCGIGLVVSRGGVAGNGVRLQRAVVGLCSHTLEPRGALGPLQCVALRAQRAQIERSPYPASAHRGSPRPAACWRPAARTGAGVAEWAEPLSGAENPDRLANVLESQPGRRHFQSFYHPVQSGYWRIPRRFCAHCGDI